MKTLRTFIALAFILVGVVIAIGASGGREAHQANASVPAGASATVCACYRVTALGSFDPEDYVVAFKFRSDDGLRSIAGTIGYSDSTDDSEGYSPSIMWETSLATITRGRPGTIDAKIVASDDPRGPAIVLDSGPAVWSTHLP